MIFKTVFILIAISCLCQARPQGDLTEEEEEALGAFHKAVDDFFTDLWYYIEYVMDELDKILAEWTENNGADTEELTELEDKLKHMEQDLQENLIDGKISSDPDSVLPIVMEVPERGDDVIESPPLM